MAIIKIKTTEVIETSIDTDTFTNQMWKDFIIKYVPHHVIVHTRFNDLFWQDKLKEEAVRYYNWANTPIWD